MTKDTNPANPFEGNVPTMPLPNAASNTASNTAPNTVQNAANLNPATAATPAEPEPETMTIPGLKPEPDASQAIADPTTSEPVTPDAQSVADQAPVTNASAQTTETPATEPAIAETSASTVASISPTESISTEKTNEPEVATAEAPSTAAEKTDSAAAPNTADSAYTTEAKSTNSPKSSATSKKSAAAKVSKKSTTIAAKADSKTDKSAKKPKDNTKSAKAKPEFVPVPKKHSHLTLQIIIIILLGLSLLTSAASLAYCIWDFFRDDPAVTFNYGSDGNTATFTDGSIAEIAARVTPGVVSIVTEVQTTSFFGQSATSTAAGTGMIVTADGYILTNKHVIEGASNIKVVLDDGTTYDQIDIAGADPLNDVAYLKIKDGKDLPTVTLGNSKTVTAGQPVIAIGNALGQFQNTITSGIVSGTGRVIQATSSDYSTSESLTDLIQTDAAINSGNSGGPLVNAAGEVIGINTATSTDADGIGFAIPISSVKGMLKNIIENHSAKRAYLGVYYLGITPDVAAAYNLPVSAGAYIYSAAQYSAVANDSPAAKAGLKDKDIILKVNGVTVGSAGSVSTLIGEYAPGDTVQLTILRDGKEHTVNVTLSGYSS